MTQLTSFIREIMPAWLQRRAEPQSGDARTAAGPLCPEDADAVWREAVENDLFGANTPDYAETVGKGRSRH